MVDVRLEQVTKRFEDVVAADDVSLEIEEGRFFTLLGPSGCGKTTILRIIAGFTRQDKGNVYLGEKLVNDVPPHRRNTGLVFQTYALWPHMRVFDNVAFGLDFQKKDMERREKERRVQETLKLVGLEGLGSRFPSQLSGGQQQRVALARALVIEPSVLLLDEPLSNLDAKLRIHMRTEIKNIQKRLSITTIYVTHDQEEALSISDEIAILNKGAVQQIGPPRSVYEKPDNSFVAGFIGLANFLQGCISEIKDGGPKATVTTKEGVEIRVETQLHGLAKGTDVIASIRPEAIALYEQGSAPIDMNRIDGSVRLTSYLGNIVRYEIQTDWGDTMHVDICNPRHQHIFHEGEKVSMIFDSKDVNLIETE